MSAPYSPRQELQQRIAAKLREDQLLTDDGVNHVALLVSAMFYTVEDEWSSVNITTIGYNGKQWLENRFLVARLPVQGIAFERPTDRTVGGAS